MAAVVFLEVLEVLDEFLNFKVLLVRAVLHLVQLVHAPRVGLPWNCFRIVLVHHSFQLLGPTLFDFVQLGNQNFESVLVDSLFRRNFEVEILCVISYLEMLERLEHMDKSFSHLTLFSHNAFE